MFTKKLLRDLWTHMLRLPLVLRQGRPGSNGSKLGPDLEALVGTFRQAGRQAGRQADRQYSFSAIGSRGCGGALDVGVSCLGM